MWGLVVAALCIALNGFFVAAEFALVKVRATQLHSRARRGEQKAIVAQSIVGRLDRYLSVTQFGITLASLGLGWVGEPAVAAPDRPRGRRPQGSPVPPTVHVVVDVAAFTVLTFAHVLFGELVPEARRHPALGGDGAGRGDSAPRHLLDVPAAALAPRARLGGHSAVDGDVTRRGQRRGPVQRRRDPRHPRGQRRAISARARRSPSCSSASCASRSARRATRWSLASTSFRCPSRRAARRRAVFVRTHQYSRILLTRGRSLDEVAGYLYAKDFLLHPDAGDAPRPRVAAGATSSSCPRCRAASTRCARCSASRSRSRSSSTSTAGRAGSSRWRTCSRRLSARSATSSTRSRSSVIKVPGTTDAWEVDGRASMEELRAIGVEMHESALGETVGAHVVEMLGPSAARRGQGGARRRRHGGGDGHQPAPRHSTARPRREGEGRRRAGPGMTCSRR